MKKLVMYFRISKEDELIVNESNSITNQREQIKRYIRNHGDLKEYDCVELFDDGFSGTNMNRPGIQKLLEMVKQQQIGCVVVKDFSRFARDYLEVGKYIEQIFPFIGIRFISINDNYDSNNFVGGIAEIDVPFQNLMYDLYAKDLSEKVRTSLTAIKGDGNYVANHAPYGYLKNPNNRHQLVIDESATKIVKCIFKEYMDGKSMYQIAQKLNAEQISSPAVHAFELNEKAGFASVSKLTVWTTTAVSRILENETYMGTMVYNKFQTRNVGDKRSHLLPREQWKKIQNCHKAIITIDDFQRVQNKKNANFKAKNKHIRHCLCGKVICGNCGKVMAHQMSGKPKYHCNTRLYDKSIEGCVTSIRDEDLESVILQSLQMQMNLFVDTKEIRESQEVKKQQRLQKAEQNIQGMHRTVDKLNADVKEGYEAFKSGLTDKESYIQQKQVYDELLVKMEENIRKQVEKVDCIADEDTGSVGGMKFEEGEFNLAKLTKEMVDVFVSKVVVMDDHRIEIVWKFRDDNNR